MSISAHLDTLEEKHLKLDSLIEREALRPMPDFSSIQTWKKQKLLFKEEMGRIQRTYGIRQGDVA
jgi:hypothetical protein